MDNDLRGIMPRCPDVLPDEMRMPSFSALDAQFFGRSRCLQIRAPMRARVLQSKAYCLSAAAAGTTTRPPCSAGRSIGNAADAPHADARMAWSVRQTACRSDDAPQRPSLLRMAGLRVTETSLARAFPLVAVGREELTKRWIILADHLYALLRA